MSQFNLKTNELGHLQFTLLNLLWQLGSATTQILLDAWPHGQPPAYVTILTVLNRLEKRGILTHVLQGRAFVYRTVVSAEEVKRQLLQDLLTRLFDSSVDLVATLLECTNLTTADLTRIESLVALNKQQSIVSSCDGNDHGRHN